ncbi:MULTISPECIES: class I SAM-dependent methyltransferase [Staphylococcus]|uniref:Methyltransferase domain-containing protein n=1 Tax=Staphylococcus agnetis TaxID=985762 RepID=A0A2T4MHP7_9STAP|nr:MULTISPECIES: class I SAM-dependent methyltransferase [Staphylococcus]ALN77062.1 class I SAM-dependent methyltransferase [Staphylococcus agnetis]MDG4943244.1 class I SAM-dependent methyltransferase [Staphylococcus agnetis]NHM91928.1 class I SAM-dependent methyltransferase [Staphylococcus sp. 10602379]NJI02524.1 methyltransferase domain-containing protein [Staphylococcus agnetis]NJI12357.1 methyltransferase domain-containing protein [Staphylococcus agnetis]
MKQEAGHTFLAKLGKTRLRPGGKKATDWLIKQGQFSKNKRVLEVACNMCTTSIYLAQTYGCQIDAIDLNKKALMHGQQNVKNAGLENLIHTQQANALSLPFEDQSFDIVLNEAMLTMLPLVAKTQALKEYYRVLKPGGVLLTHDIAIMNEHQAETIRRDLSEAINVKVTPLPKSEWLELYHSAQFQSIAAHQGPMTLMTPKGMIYDEGFKNTVKIIKNALKNENRPMFKHMFTTFKKHKNDLNYIVFCARKTS